MRSRSSFEGTLSATLAWLSAASLLAGCAEMFAVERAEGVRGTPDGGEVEGGESGAEASDPTSVVSANRQEPPANEESPSEAVEESEGGEEPPSVVMETEPELAEEGPIPQPSKEEVPGGAEYIPPIPGVKSYSVRRLSAKGSTLSTALIPGRGICISGESVLLYNEAGEPDYVYSWGAAIKMYVADWVPEDVGIQGLSFNLVGDVPAYRFQAFLNGKAYCTELVGEGRREIVFTDLQVECYNNVESNEYFVGPTVDAVEWQIFSGAGGAKPFDFCIEELAGIESDGPLLPDVEKNPDSEADSTDDTATEER